MTVLTMAYIRRKKFEGQAALAAWGQAMQDGKGERISPDGMMAMMMGAF